MNCRRGDHYHGDSVRLTDIDTLTFYNNRYTTGYRSKPIRQMKCISGYSNCRHAPSNMQCYNRGTDGRDVQWECKAEMEKGYSLGRTEVSCEGYSYPDDPYILAGSCGVEFEVNKNHDYSTYNHHYSNSSFDWNPFSWITGFFNFIFFLVLIFFFVFMIGMNNIVRVIAGIFKIIFFPVYLLTYCCNCCRGPAYATYMPPPPPMFHNTFGDGWIWYHMGREDERRNSYRRSVPVYESYNYSSPSDSDSTHVSTSYASTKRR